MTEDELIALIESEEANCVSSTSGALAEQRREAMQYYYGFPYGNEVEGRSQVVTTEVKDSVEGILPSLMSIFTTTDEIVRCEPQNPDDEAAAQQATDYLNYLFTRMNNGFLTLYCLFKDALLQKNGYAKVYWEDYSDQGIETYTDLTEMEAAMLLQDEELELIETVKAEDNDEVFEKAVFRRTKEGGKICIDPIPPEEVLISRETPNDLTKARFVEHRTLKTISEIREMGFDIDDEIADYSPNADFSLERVERNLFDDANAYKTDNTTDPTTRRVWLSEAYLFVDFDGDGIAEFRKVTKVGTTLLDNVEFDGLPIVGGTAILMPHKHYGLSLHDLVKDIQQIKTQVTRQLLDNAYVANNGRMVVLDGMVNMDDLLTVRPNGIVRAKTLGAVQRLENPMLGAPFYNLLEYFDKVKQNRIGATDFPNAVDPDAINAKAAFVDAYKAGAMERVALMARILAETVVKPLFWKMLELISKHQQKPQVVKLRGMWTEIDPREWRNKFNMTITVGLGTGSQQTVINGIQTLANLAAGMVQAGFGRVVSEENAYHIGHVAAKSLFPREAELFFTDPKTLPPPQPPPNVDLMKVQLAAQKAAKGDQQKYAKMMLDYQNAERDREVALKQMGIDVLQMVSENRMHNLDQQQQFGSEVLSHVVDLHKHSDQMKQRPSGT